jgi:hypothetical protein
MINAEEWSDRRGGRDLVMKDEEDDRWFRGGREVVVKDCGEDEDWEYGV